jgi:AbrB family looped-hinge helix DNA binding protein
MLRVTMNSQNEIVIPLEARERLGLRPGDQLNIHVKAGRIVLEKRLGELTDSLRGLLRGSFGENADEYLSAERRAWGTAPVTSCGSKV